MKKIYSTLLLFSFLIGAIQPVVPLLEYHFFKESIIEFFCVNREVPDSDCDGFCYLTNQIEETEQQQNDLRTNHVDYYPGAVLTHFQSGLNVYPEQEDRFPDLLVYGVNLSPSTELPPPKGS